VNITIIGAGSWGTALSLVLADSGHNARLWAREPELTGHLNEHHTNLFYLKGIELPSSIKCYSSFSEALNEAQVVVFATPSHVMRQVAGLVKSHLKGHETLISVVKGIENETYLTMSQVLTEVFDGIIPQDKIGVLYGPSHAEEVALRKPTAVVAASYSSTTAREIQQLFRSPMFRVYINHDVIGVEVAGSIKNIMAIASGIADGAGFGDNSIAAIVTRGLQEIKRLGMRLGASQDTFSGLAGIGDLVVTCTSKHSRNRQVGHRIGKGESLDDIIESMNMIAEGIKTTRSVYGWAQKLNVEMPITNSVYKVLFEDMDPKVGVYQLMTREQKEEILF